MRYQRDDEIYEVECDRCHMRLTEVIVGTMPKDFFTARIMAMMAGWICDLEAQYCAGCLDVSQL